MQTLKQTVQCGECKAEIVGPKVLKSFLGYFIGRSCDCGVYSRASNYYPDEKAAKKALHHLKWGQ